MIRLNGLNIPGVRVIGLCSTTGPQSGKSTVAKIIQDYITKSEAVVLSFATPIKVQASAIYGEYDKSEVVPGTGEKTYRDILIELGESARRVCPDIWVRALESNMKRLIAKAQLDRKQLVVIIDDVRKDNEYRQIIDWGGSVYNVVRPGNGKRDCQMESHHFSTPRTLINSGSLEALTQHVISKVFPYGL